MPLLLLGAGLFGGLLSASATDTAAAIRAGEIRAEARYDKEVAFDNAEFARLDKAGAIRTGNIQAGAIELERRQIRGAQRAIVGAGGLEAGFGTTAALSVETDKLARMDMITAKNNAWRAAWGFEMEALQFEKAGIQGIIAADREAAGVFRAGRAKAVGQAFKSLLFAGASASKLPTGGGGDIGGFTPVTPVGGAFLGQRRGKQVGAASAGFGGFRRRF